MDASLPFKLIDYKSRSQRKTNAIYCVKFCPYSEEFLFAAAVLNKIEIYNINENGKIGVLKTFVAAKDEYFYALDWTFDTKSSEIILIGGGEFVKKISSMIF